MSEQIVIQGARQHNLKNISLALPKNKLVVITGLSGSGKSSLAFDTLYAEGQRRYVASLSAYARQFLERLEKPEVDFINGLSPAIAIEQKGAGHNPRSTVGTVTEIYDYLRLLYARIGQAHCPQCGRPVTSQSLDQMLEQLHALPPDSKLVIMAPLVRHQKGDQKPLLTGLRKEGFARVRIDDTIFELDPLPALKATRAHNLDVVIDRLVLRPRAFNRLADALELALSRSGGQAIVQPLNGSEILFSEHHACSHCQIAYPRPEPAAFSFNAPQGACPECDGIGVKRVIDIRRLVPNPSLSVREGAILPWAGRNSMGHMERLIALFDYFKADIWTPFSRLPEKLQKTLLYGKKGKTVSRKNPPAFEGIVTRLNRQYAQTTRAKVRADIETFMNDQPCPACNGARLNPFSRAVTVGGQPVAAITALPISQSLVFFDQLELTPKQTAIAARVVREIQDRLVFLKNVGLGYLSLSRTAGSLSGGESQRIRLATQIGARLSGVLYVLDEPSIGLHQRDNDRLLETLAEMRDLGNTVLVVEHDEETVLQADHVVEMGPGAGIKGGSIVFEGDPGALVKSDRALTGQYLSGRREIAVPSRRRKGNGQEIVIEGACAHNLQKIDVSFPLGRFVCVTGVSGSGKSSLVLGTLFPAVRQRLYTSHQPPGPHQAIHGLRHIDKAIHIDQSPIGRTPRSNPGTYTGVLGHIRELFAKTREARTRGYKAGRFSFNVKGGRCESCRGEGIVRIEMHFLPDVYVPCEVCQGRRYNKETLEIHYRGKNMDDVLQLTVDQGVDFFERISLIRNKLKTLSDVGLGYIRIGQPATTLSGGEAQRVKLARELSKKATGRTFYILDEPTTGLHLEDIRQLLLILQQLVDAGNTVLVIEHNLHVIKTADHVIDLGPEGGDEGGKIIALGTPEMVARNAASHTGRYLKTVLGR